jgi:nitroreductase
VLCVPEGKLVAFVMDLGYPADRPLKPGTRLKRRTFDEVVHRNGW